MENVKSKIIKVFNKISYILQFVLTVFFGIFLFKDVLIKASAGYFDKMYTILTIVFGIVILALMIYHIKRDYKKIENMFLNFSFLLGVVFIVLIVPGQIPDEEAHMMKTYEISQGIFQTQLKEDGTSSATIPEDMLQYNHNITDSYVKTNELLNQKTDYEKTVERVSSAQGYSCILYIIPAIALFIGRNLGFNLLISIYLAKLLNLIFFIVMGYFTIKKMPFGKIIMAVYLLMPMMIHQAVSFSADVVINAVSLFYLANLLNMLVKKEDLTIKELILHGVLCTIVSVAKIAYMPLVMISVLLLFRKNARTKLKIVLITLSIILSVIFAFVEYKHSTIYITSPESMIEYNKQLNIDSGKQIEYMIANKLETINTFRHDWENNGGMYITDAIGKRLGWLDIDIPMIYIILYIGLIVYSLVIEKNEETLKIGDKIWILAIGLGMVIIVQLAMFMGATPVGGQFVGGVQGRYFIPILILPLLCMCKKENFVNVKYSTVIPILVSTFINMGVLLNIYKNFMWK